MSYRLFKHYMAATLLISLSHGAETQEPLLESLEDSTSGFSTDDDIFAKTFVQEDTKASKDVAPEGEPQLETNTPPAQPLQRCKAASPSKMIKRNRWGN